jgi:dihydrofolate reductase
MGKIVVCANVTLDGVVQVQDPDGAEGFRHGGWFDQIMATMSRDEFTRVEFGEWLGAESMLLGRRSDEWFAARWASRTGEPADRMNSLPKYVVSSTLHEARWTNSTVLKGDVVMEVSKLKQRLDGDIVVWASGQLVRTLMEHDLVDELRLMVFPVVVGAGERLFGRTSDKVPLRLVASRTVGDGLTYLTYEVVRTCRRDQASGLVKSFASSHRPVRAVPGVDAPIRRGETIAPNGPATRQRSTWCSAYHTPTAAACRCWASHRRRRLDTGWPGRCCVADRRSAT